jgi:hypothetical protein
MQIFVCKQQLLEHVFSCILQRYSYMEQNGGEVHQKDLHTLVQEVNAVTQLL